MISAAFFIFYYCSVRFIFAPAVDPYADPRQHKLQITPLAACDKARSLRCASFPNATRCAGLAFGLPLSQRSCHGLGRLALSGAGHMGVGIQSKTGGEVPQHTGHRLDIHPVLQSQSGEGVPEIMKPDLRQSCPLQHPMEHVQHTVRRNRATIRRWKDPLLPSLSLKEGTQRLTGVNGSGPTLPVFSSHTFFHCPSPRSSSPAATVYREISWH